MLVYSLKKLCTCSRKGLENTLGSKVGSRRVPNTKVGHCCGYYHSTAARSKVSRNASTFLNHSNRYEYSIGNHMPQHRVHIQANQVNPWPAFDPLSSIAASCGKSRLVVRRGDVKLHNTWHQKLHRCQAGATGREQQAACSHA